MKKRILLVDDESDMTLLFYTALGDSGFQVDTFNDGMKA
jgi:DNA-binding response OmpR family regulator